ncbi:hypothetical protein ACFLSW_05275 [Candidatus Bipolaricaulota bacterium]
MAKGNLCQQASIYTQSVNMLDSLSNLVLLVVIVVGVLFLPQMFSSVGDQDSITATSPSRAAYIYQQHPDWPPHYCQHVANGVVTHGMSTDMVELAWGNPTATRVDGALLLLAYSGFLSESGDLVRSPANMKGLIVEVMLREGVVVGIQEHRDTQID